MCSFKTVTSTCPHCGAPVRVIPGNVFYKKFEKINQPFLGLTPRLLKCTKCSRRREI